MKAILKKLHSVMLDITYIQKDAKNTFHHYSYASERAIKEACGKAFREHGIIMQLETSNPQVISLETDKVPMMTTIDCTYTFYDVESSEHISGVFTSSGPGRDDKGLWAATTNAIKYILTSTFLIPTGDDTESEVNHPPQTQAAAKKKPEPANPQKTRAERFGEYLGERAKEQGCELSKAAEVMNGVITDLGCSDMCEELCLKEGVEFPIMASKQLYQARESMEWEVLWNSLSSFDLAESLTLHKQAYVAKGIDDAQKKKKSK